MTRGERLLEMCREYAETEGATCSGMLTRIESFLSAPVTGNRLWLVSRELSLAKEDAATLRKIKLSQAGVEIALKVVESIEKMGYAYTYTLEVAMYFRSRGFKVERSDHKVSYLITEPEEVGDSE